MQANVAGIFPTKEEASKFVQNLPSEMYVNCNFSVNQDLLSALKNKRLNISENEQVIVIEVAKNQLIEVQSLIKNANGRYITSEELDSWRLMNFN